MLDSLLGRAELKERIAELESEVASLESQLAAEESRRAEAVENRQEAEEQLNRLQDRIADLEGQLERTRDGERVLEFRERRELSPGRIGEVLDRLESVRTEPEGALTAMVTESAPQAVRDVLGERAALVNRAAPCLLCADDAGLVSVALDPPLQPDPFERWDDRFRIERGWFQPGGEIGFALVRSDLFAYGTYTDGDRDDFEGFESQLEGNHSKGGFSQTRFERRRDEQIQDHVETCRGVLAEHDPDRLVVVGERTVLNEFADIATVTATVDATGDPAAALDDAFRSFFTARLYAI